jgi:asparagine synthase (glutamine-hydrolysing)
VDSAAVSALASETNEDIRAYTVDFPHQGSFSEGPKAAIQAEYSGLPHRVIPLTAEEILRDLAEAVGQTEGLCVNGHLVAKMKLAEAVAKDGRQVLLTGEGADELLFGYRHFSRYFGEVADPLVDTAGLGILTTTAGDELPRSYPAFFHSKLALGRRVCMLLGLQHNPSSAFGKLIVSKENADPLDSARQAWLDTALASYILEVLGDGTEMSHSVEGRPPFLDHTLWELAIRPTSTDKGLLRHALRGKVVDQILTSPKHPFMAAPLGDDLIARLRQEVLEQQHAFLHRDSALRVLARVETLERHERLEWEPAMIWVLSSFYLQRIFGAFSS